MDQSSVVGSWKLISFEARRTDGTVLYPYGRDAVGRLTYDGAGHMAVQVASVHRHPFTGGDPLGARPEEAKAAIDTYTGYFGSYEIDHEQGIVTHHIDASVFPNWSGSDQRRFFDLSGDQLTLSTAPYHLGGAQATSHLIWEREP